MTARRDPDIQPAPDRAAETLSAMRPADVPAHLYRRALDAVLSLDDDGPRAVTVQQEVAAALAAVLPEHERQVREQAAAEIEALRDGTHGKGKPYNQAFMHALDCAIRHITGGHDMSAAYLDHLTTLEDA